jgi:hypothetical protein
MTHTQGTRQGTQQGTQQGTRQEIHHDIRRRRDGSIDVDFYRVQATALRAQTIRDAFSLKVLAQFRTPFKQWWMRLVLLPIGRCLPGFGNRLRTTSTS